ncbi:MAG: DUF1559 domain-containing protein [Planctomycetaceae bacterium]|nr:DUF1559 domain-containing protein [Planctomycetaceae bacterium]
MSYPFPPSAWDMQNWSLNPGCTIHLLMIAMIAVAWKRKKNDLPTHVLLACTLIYALWQFSALDTPTTREPPTFRHSMLQYALFYVACCGGLALLTRTAWLWWCGANGPGVLETIFVSVPLLFALGNVLLPSMGHPEGSRRTQCKNNLKQIGLAMHNYHDVHASFPPLQVGPIPQTWRLRLLPFLDPPDRFLQIHDDYDYHQPWYSQANVRFATTAPEFYTCPSALRAGLIDSSRLTAYVGLESSDALLSVSAAQKIRDVKDGTSNTMMIVESCGSDIIWTEPRDAVVPDGGMTINGPGAQAGLSSSPLSSWHTGGAQILLGDGSVRFLSEQTDPAVLRALMTADGGESQELHTDW